MNEMPKDNMRRLVVGIFIGLSAHLGFVLYSTLTSRMQKAECKRQKKKTKKMKSQRKGKEEEEDEEGDKKVVQVSSFVTSLCQMFFNN